MILENLPSDSVQFHVPLDALGIAQVNLVNVFAVLLLQLGLMHSATWMFGQGGSVELLERQDGTSVTQFQRFIRSQVPGLGQAGGEGDDTGGDNGCEVFHDDSPFQDVLPTLPTVRIAT